MRQRGLRRASAFSLPRRLWRGDVLRCVDLHCGGEPATVVLGKDVPGATMEAKRQHIMRHEDAWRRLLLHEPRGYPCSNVDFLLAPTVAEADYGFVIAEQDAIYPLMSGHNTICVATALVECGLLPADRRERFVLEAPSGPVPVEADVAEDGRCRSITFQGPPSFVAVRDALVDLGDAARALGLAADKVRVDIAYGGMWYVIVDAADLGLALVPEEGARIRAAGELVKKACQRDYPVERPPAWKSTRKSARAASASVAGALSSGADGQRRAAPRDGSTASRRRRDAGIRASTTPARTSWLFAGRHSPETRTRATPSSCPTATRECSTGARAGAGRVRSWHSSTRAANSI